MPGSSTASPIPVELDLRPSPALRLVRTVLHLALLLPPLIYELPMLARVCWLLAVALSALREMTAARVTGLRRGRSGRWLLLTSRGAARAVLLRWFAHPRLCALVLRDQRGRRRYVVVPRDATDPDGHRRLRLTLRLEPTGVDRGSAIVAGIRDRVRAAARRRGGEAVG